MLFDLTMTANDKNSSSITTLLLIDVQNDFHPPSGSLAVPGADGDAARLSALLATRAGSFDRVVATMDSHHELHVAHPGFWTDASGEKRPSPFTMISHEDVVAGTWRPAFGRPTGAASAYEEADHSRLDPEVFAEHANVVDANGVVDLRRYVEEYTRSLEAKGRFRLVVWPEHCLIGSEGHNMVPKVRAALSEWSRATGRSVEWVHKGRNVLTESYSALRAEVPVDHFTSLNVKLLESLASADRVVVAGQALSHCVNHTVRDIVEQLPSEQASKICLLKDCCSSVPGFEEAGQTFLKDMEEAGVTICTSETVFDL